MFFCKKWIKMQCFFTLQYLNVVKELSGYNSIAFPYCLSSVRHDGYVIPKLTFAALEFVACSPMGEPEVCIFMNCKVLYLTPFLCVFYYIFVTLYHRITLLTNS